MVFSSLIFLFIFMPLFLLLYFAFKKRTIRNNILLLFSIFFYAWGEPVYILLIIFSTIANYYFAILIDSRKQKKAYLISAVIFNVGLIAIFKYTNFIIDIINNIFKLNITSNNIPLPIGISFFTFQILSYVIDVYRKEVKVQKNILFLGTYIVAFPQLIAGPIVRYQTVEDELVNRKETLDIFAVGVRRFIKGLGKKVLIANTVGFITTTIFSQIPLVYGFLGAWVGIIAYTLQIYFDFSGYSDMAIGMGKMLGFNYLENFNFPYIARSVTDFWRRWHISLSTFFRDYVYIPLGGNRVSKIKWIRNVLIVWTLTGLWHGANYNFVLWGLYFAILLILEKLFLQNVLNKLPKVVGHIYLLLIVVFSWVIFRSDNLIQALDTIKSMFGFNGIGNTNLFYYTGIINLGTILVFFIGAILTTPILEKIKINNTYITDTILLIILLLSIVSILTSSYNPFIYYRF